MVVDNVFLNLSGNDTVAAGLIFGGIHARKYGYARVKKVNITVDGGTYGRIHGGGWAEKGAYSVVNHASITVNSGTIEYVYAGGCNATSETGYEKINGSYVGSADITIDSAAQVKYVYLGARYAAGKIGGDVTLTITGAKDSVASFTRITGWGSTGMDSSENGSSIVELETSVKTDYFDFVDKLIVHEYGTLNTASADFGTDQKIVLDLVTDGLDKDWTVISGEGLDEIMAAIGGYALNGVVTELTDGQLGDYTLNYDEDEKKLTLGLA